MSFIADSDPMHTSIRIRTETRERLGKIGHYEESLDDIINRLLDEHEKKKK